MKFYFFFCIKITYVLICMEIFSESLAICVIIVWWSIKNFYVLLTMRKFANRLENNATNRSRRKKTISLMILKEKKKIMEE